MVIYTNIKTIAFQRQQVKGGITMLEYILKILRDAPDSILNNALYNVLEDFNLRNSIRYEADCDKFTFSRRLVDQKTEHELICKITAKNKTIEGTNIRIMLWGDSILFWLE